MNEVASEDIATSIIINSVAPNAQLFPMQPDIWSLFVPGIAAMTTLGAAFLSIGLPLGCVTEEGPPCPGLATFFVPHF